MNKKKHKLSVEVRFGKYLMNIYKKGFSLWYKNRWFIDASTLFDDGELKINREHKDLPHFKKIRGHQEHYSFRMEAQKSTTKPKASGHNSGLKKSAKNNKK